MSAQDPAAHTESTPSSDLTVVNARSGSRAFLYTGLLLLILALLPLLLGMVHPSLHGGISRLALAITVALSLAGGILLYAHVRSRTWTAEAEKFLLAGTQSENVPDQTHWTRQEIGAVTILTLVGFLPRLMALRHSLWYDELWTTSFMRSGPVYALTHQGGYNNHLFNSLLGSLLLKLRFLLTGLAPSTGAAANWVRFPAFLFGTLSVPMLYVAARDYIPRPAASIAAFLLALSPVAIDLSTQTRGYSGVLFFALISSFCFGRAVQTARPEAWIGWLLCATLGIFSHLYLLFVVFVSGLLTLGLVLRGLWKAETRKRGAQLLEQGLVMLGVWALLGGICYSGVFYALRKEFGRTYESGPMARAHDVVVPALQLWGGTPVGVWLNVYYFVAALLIVSGLVYLLARRSLLGLFLPLLLLLPPLLVEKAKPHFVYPRFFAFALPAFLLLLACGLWQVSFWIGGASPERRTLRVTLGGLAAIAFVCLTLPGLHEVLALPKQDYEQAALLLARLQQEGKTIAVIGAGNEYFKTYGAHPLYPQSPEELIHLAQVHGGLVVGDTNIMVNAHTPPSRTTAFMQQAGQPLKLFPGRLAHWPSRWLDGNSDVIVYFLPANISLPPRRK